MLAFFIFWWALFNRYCFLQFWKQFFFLGSWFKNRFIWLHGVLVVAHRIFKCSRWTLSCGIWDLVPWPGIKSGPPASGPSHWITMEEPQKCLYQATTRFVIEKLLNVSGGFFFFSYSHLGFSGPLEKNFLLSQGGWEGRGAKCLAVGVLGEAWGRAWGCHYEVDRPFLHPSVFHPVPLPCPSNPAWDPWVWQPLEFLHMQQGSW